MSPRSTADVARLVGVGPASLERWLAQGRVPVPKRIRIGTRMFRLWTSQDIKQVKKVISRNAEYDVDAFRSRRPDPILLSESVGESALLSIVL